MTDIIRKTLQNLSRFFPTGIRRERDAVADNDDDIQVISAPDLEGIHYGCDGCNEAIKEGEFRYNCNDCVYSYDLCQSCYDTGMGESHTKEKGHLHEFTCETRNNFAVNKEVRAETLEETLANMFRLYANRPAIGSYIASRQRYEYLSFRELEQFVSSFASTLHHVMTRDHTHMVSICSVVRLEWYIVDYACALLGIPTVGITASTDEETTGFILNQTEASVIVCSCDHLTLFLSLAANKCPQLREIVVMDLNEEEDIEPFGTTQSNIRVWKLTDFLSKGAEYPVDYRTFRTDSNDIFTIAYTSGSTGKPKGCVFTRDLWFRHILTQSNASLLGIRRIWFSFQPPSHMMERESFHMTLLSGCKAGIYRGTMEHLFEDIRLIRPTVITSTPRFFSIIYNQYLQAVHEEYQKFPSCSNDETAAQNDQLPKLDLSKIPHEVKDKVKEKFKNFLGGREKMIGIGGAAVPLALVRFLQDCFDGVVQEGYGTTEAGSITNGDWSLGDVIVRLKDVPELGYLTTDVPPRGEVCVKTSFMITGYYKNDEETREKFHDGYFCTGDIGVMERPGYVRVIDRKKNIFKLAQGEFVAPEKIELIFENQSSLVNQVYIYGNIWQMNVVALIVPHREGLRKWWESRQMKGNESDVSYDAMCTLPEVCELFLNEVRTLGEAHKLLGWEIPSAVLLEPEPFTEENHLLTSTLKKSRPNLEMKYKEQLEKLYKPSEEEETFTKRSIEDDVMANLIDVLKNRGMAFPSSKYFQMELSVRPINLTLSLTQLGGDSLTAMSLSNLLQEELSIAVSAVFLLRQPLLKIFQYILSQLSPDQVLDIDDIALPGQTSYASSTGTIDWNRETKIDFLNISASAVRLTESTSQLQENGGHTVLLTGATGFLGKYILLELLKSSSCNRVYCLCRHNESQSAEIRVTGVIKEIVSEQPTGTTEYDALASKFVVVSGDLSKARLGLDDEDFAVVSHEVDVVIHNGAIVNHILLYDDLKSANVQSTREILKLCCQKNRQKYLHYVSSLGVFSLHSSELASELTEPNRERLHQLSGYSQSKWVSERLVLKAISDGYIKGSISRPGLIGAHSITGHSNRQDWFYQLVYSLSHLQCYPVGPSWDAGATSIVAVDTVARAISELSLSLSSDYLVYHLGNTRPQTMVTFNDIIDSLEKVVPDTVIQPLDEQSFKERLSDKVKHATTTTVYNIAPLFALHLLLSQGMHPMSPNQSVITSEITNNALKPFGIDLNASNNGYMDRYVAYLRLKKILQ